MAKYIISVSGNLVYDLAYGQSERKQTTLNVTIEMPVDLTRGMTMDPTYAKKLAQITTALDKATTLVVNRQTFTLVAGNLIVKYGIAGKEKTESFTVTSAKDFAEIKTFITDNAPRNAIKNTYKAKL